MANVWSWLTSSVDCRAVLKFFTPTVPIDDSEHTRQLLVRIDKIAVEKEQLIRELAGLRNTFKQQKANNKETKITTAQIEKHLARLKLLDTQNLHLVNQYEQLNQVNVQAELLETSVVTTALVGKKTREMRGAIRRVGGGDLIKEAQHQAADTLNDANDIIDISSRDLVPHGERSLVKSGIYVAPPSIEEQMAAYLDAEEGDSVAASSVQEPPIPHQSPFIGHPLPALITS
ncbi:MAG: hypothetical protein ACOVQN_09860 [Exiguobacterium sp.]